MTPTPSTPPQPPSSAVSSAPVSGLTRWRGWRWLLRLLWFALIVATVLPAIAYFFGSRFIFHPTRDSSEVAARRAGNTWRTVRVQSQQGVVIGGVVRPPTQHAAPWVLFFGGNAAPISGNLALVDNIRGDSDTGLATFAYRGYDDSIGTPSEEGLLTDARAIVGELNRQWGVQPSRLILIGQSLGSGVAAALAEELCQAQTPPRKLVLVSPYRSMAARFDDATWPFPVGWALSDSFRTDRRLPSVSCPILIVHGTADRVIAVRHARELAALLGSRAQYWEIADAGHNDIYAWLEPRRLIADCLDKP